MKTQIKLDWINLLSKNRLHAKSHDDNTDYDARNEYQRDIDRIIFSTAFRRLQDKTQVMPMPDSDFVRSRLTHSLEVASLGRSMGKLIGKFVVEKENLDKKHYSPDDFGNIVAAACLAHDIGNPPYGHSGEKAIGEFFNKFLNDPLNDEILKDLSDSQKLDLIKFEGNACGLRVLANNHPSGVKGGLRLTFAVLGTFIKYPKGSEDINENEEILKFNFKGKNIKNEKRKSQSKFGYFNEESVVFKNIIDELKLIPIAKKGEAITSYCRHPLAFIMEAADSVAYHIMDFEDGHKMNFIPTQIVQKHLFNIIKNSTDERCVKDDWQKIKNKDEKIGALRSKALNQLIYECVQAFKENYKQIMTGEFDQELVDIIPASDILRKIKDEHTIENYYRHSSVIDNELAGYEVLGSLLALFVSAIPDPNSDKSKKILLKMPTHFSKIIKDKKAPIYLKLLTCADHVARMTDGYALSQYQKFYGH